jgi:hypothetical protein
MKAKLQNLVKRLSVFHSDESGSGPMDSVMLLGVSALVVVALIAVGVYIFKKVRPSIEASTKDPGFETPK